jgi:hypothetical protein
VAWGRSGLVSPIPRATTGRGVANQTAEFFGANRGGPVWSTGCRICVTIANIDRELAQLEIASVNLMLAVPKGHPLANSKSSACGLERCLIHLVSKAGESAFL